MDWYRFEDSEVLVKLNSGLEGLSAVEAATRIGKVGRNELSEAGKRGPWLIFWEQLKAFMVLVLIAAAVISAATGDFKDAIAIGAIVVLNAVLGFIQEYRAEKAMAALQQMAVPIARVRRGGQTQDISSAELVPGDILFIEAGSFVGADCRLIEASHLQVQEAALTGESEPVRKQAGRLEGEGLPLGDRLNMAHRGTFVAAGRGTAVVTETGMRTELGKIATLIQAVKQEPTPMQKRLDEVGKGLALVALSIVAVIFAMGLLRGEDLKLMLLTAVSIGVAAVPEGLPAVVTIALTLGAQRMLKRNVLVRRLAAVETLGSVTVICSDKTGTLTQNRMEVRRLDWADAAIELEPLAAGKELSPGGRLLMLGGALCNDSIVSEARLGDPTEIALAAAAGQFGMERRELEQKLPRVEEFPFDAERKRMTTIHEVAGDWGVLPESIKEWKRIAFVKGSVDGLLEISSQVWHEEAMEGMNAAWIERIDRAHRDLASKGMRVLGLAMRELEATRGLSMQQVEKDLTFVGMVGIMDPPRKEAIPAMATCRRAGILGVMITGDHPLTAHYVAGELGMTSTGGVLSGKELEGMPIEELEERSGSTAVYARVTPEHKLKIVEALQRRGHIVAMTGDGVNDAPALKKSDIGVAMGITGTDVAKEAADMVLLDDNFASIVAAVEEGRIIYDNVRKFLKYILATNTGEIFLMVAAPLAGMPLPLLPLQILWLNLVTDGLPALALGVEPAEKNVMSRPPHHPEESVFARGLGWHVVWVGILMGVLCLGVGYWYWSAGKEQWQTVLFTTLAFTQMAHVMAIRSEEQSLFKIGLLSNPMLLGAVGLTIALQLGLIFVPFLQSFFHTSALSAVDLLVTVAASLILFAAVEFEKWVRRRKGSA